MLEYAPTILIGFLLECYSGRRQSVGLHISETRLPDRRDSRHVFRVFVYIADVDHAPLVPNCRSFTRLSIT